MGKRKLDGIVPMTPTERELSSWNFLFKAYIFMQPERDRGRMCYCTACRKPYRVEEWTRSLTADERFLLCAKHKETVKCPKCGTYGEARFVKISRRQCCEHHCVAVVRTDSRRDRVVIDCYALYKRYEDDALTALPTFKKWERYVLTPGAVAQYQRRSYYSRRSNDDDDPENWYARDLGDKVLEPFLNYSGTAGQYYSEYRLYGEHRLLGTFLKYNALDEWARAARYPRAVRYLCLLSLCPGLETLVKAKYYGIVSEILCENRKFYGKINLRAGSPVDILKESRSECAALALVTDRSEQALMLKARKHADHDRIDGWRISEMRRLRGETGGTYHLGEMLSFCDDHDTTPRTLTDYLLKQHERRLRQYEAAVSENGCGARMMPVAPRIIDEWTHLRDYHTMYAGVNGVAARELYPRDVAEAHDLMLSQREARRAEEERERARQYAAGHAGRMQAAREDWTKTTEARRKRAAEIDGNPKKVEAMDKRLRWRIKHLSFAEGDFMTVIPSRCAELCAEGEALHHCVGTYCEKYASGKTNIVFLRHKDHLEQPLLTLEVSNEGHVWQCYGFNDDLTYTKEKEWMQPERDKYLAVYDKSIRDFAARYELHLKEIFSKEKKVRTTA